MDNWFNHNHDLETMINISNTDYINNRISIDFLKHFIKHSKASPTSWYKLLLFDRAESHETDKFKKLTEDNNIILCCFPSYLTYILKLLDVGSFQSYKHWHKRTVHAALRNLELNYNISSFLYDLPSIRQLTFTPKTIVLDFKKASIWPPDLKLALKKMKSKSDPEEPLLLITENNVFLSTLISLYPKDYFLSPRPLEWGVLARKFRLVVSWLTPDLYEGRNTRVQDYGQVPHP
jgi:hypothetical protein